MTSSPHVSTVNSLVAVKPPFVVTLMKPVINAKAEEVSIDKTGEPVVPPVIVSAGLAKTELQSASLQNEYEGVHESSVSE